VWRHNAQVLLEGFLAHTTGFLEVVVEGNEEVPSFNGLRLNELARLLVAEFGPKVSERCLRRQEHEIGIGDGGVAALKVLPVEASILLDEGTQVPVKLLLHEYQLERAIGRTEVRLLYRVRRGAREGHIDIRVPCP